jgi:universal stress protein A
LNRGPPRSRLDETKHPIRGKGGIAMLPFKRIICPTDFSEPACKAIRAAGELAEKFSAELILIHVVGAIPALDAPTGMVGFDVSAYQKELTESAEKSLQERVEKHIPKAVAARTLVVHGDPPHEIVRAANEEKCDLIVMSTHGATGWRERIFGSVTEKVVRFADCPVLTVHRLTDTQK